jgi:hypothetical protein
MDIFYLTPKAGDDSSIDIKACSFPVKAVMATKIIRIRNIHYFQRPLNVSILNKGLGL